ncbi:MAG: hypothetical protein K8F91_14770 [Candidatus Obscuribacterales bacterium]|nr:hypothetical protein [Candidatus Obscuribacterales bacterium]
MGIFEKLHGCSLASDFALRIKAEAAKNFGTAGPEFISKLQGNRSITEKYARYRDQFIASNVPKKADGQVARAAERFIIIAFAGELATEYGITGWTTGEATEAILTCFQSWIKTRGGIGSLERSEVLSQVRLFVEQHGESRFTLINEEGKQEDRVPFNRAGFRKQGDGFKDGAGLEYFIFPEVFKNEICAGLDYHKVTRVLKEEGILITDKQGRSTCPVRLPELGTKRVFKITSEILGGILESQEPL